MPLARGVRMLARGCVRVLGKILYWLAVLVISIALLIALVLFLESRDESQVENGALPVERA
jgi:preprotein translocase subunit SecG